MTQRTASKRSFSMLELIMVMLIISMLALIAGSYLHRYKLDINDQMASTKLKLFAEGFEMYANDSGGLYPTSPGDLMFATPPYLDEDVCAYSANGYDFTCGTFTPAGYILYANPVLMGQTGTKSMQIETGSVLTIF